MEKRLIFIILLVPFLVSWHWFEPAAKKNQKGIKAYQAQKYEEALTEFLSAKGIRPDSAKLKSNTASALYQMKKYKEALEEFSKIDPEKITLSKADFYYNLGNSFFRLNQFEKALESYKKSMIVNSEDIDAKKNYELTLKKMQEQKKKDQQNKKQKKDKEKKKDKKKDKQKQQQQQQQKQKKEQKHKNIMQYLNQNEKKQLKKKKRQIGIVRKEKDW
jgi:Ca-activated chloride channel family protein